MIKRLALAGATATLALGFATTAMSIGHTSSHRRVVKPRHAAPAIPDQVVQWNQVLQKVLVAPGAQPASIHPTRTMAITQIAVYDAVNGILRRDRPLLVDIPGPRDASADAAAAAAAHTALDALLPSQAATIDASFTASMAQLPDSWAVRRGFAFGARVARTVLAARSDDGASANPPVFTPIAGPGHYQLTPPAMAPAGFTQTAHVTPFVLGSASQFRPGPPPALTSARYGADFREVQSLGELNSTTRTADQTAIGTFWGAAPVWVVWNQVADQAAARFDHTLLQNARLFAVLDTTLADSAVALYDAKYTYARWRPITAITASDQGNGVTSADPNWVPLANTANDPSYPGAHAEFSQAAATVLDRFFGTDAFRFSLSNATVGITRTFSGFSQASAEASASRIFAGQHFRYDEDAGQTLGRDVAGFVLDRVLGHPEHR
ncbi:MAG TPA: vanadium-dependent haloperoxidase [Solirubrobacteraceae bacterium]|nr:vanadium-dependent haloperoxidase [Solirubrobacteraceae bacterium]